MKFIPVGEPSLTGNELKYVTDCIQTGWISSIGGYVKKFESEFASFCDCKHAVAVTSGTTALHLSLEALSVGEGDEVIVPNITFASTAHAVVHARAKPVFVDCDEKTWNIDISKIEEQINDRTRAIIPVHHYGYPCDMDLIMDIARKHNLYVIEDAAEAHGARYKGQKVGSIGDMGTFSFFPNKIITTGEGGMCVTNNPDLDRKARILRDQGLSREGNERYRAEVVGYNYRMTNLQAAVGLAQLEQIDDFLAKRAHIAAKYNEILKDAKGITLAPEKPEWGDNVSWMYSVLLESDFPLSRDQTIAKLKEYNIDTRTMHFPLNLMPPYRDGRDLPVSKSLSVRGITLPSSTRLSDEEIEYVAGTLKSLS